ncbi:preprotein translocase subunit SecE [Desulfoscipio gibsoniae]|uniref:Protein translocase subunit SecE n=1 Tax=Desulfoscipio gibsoniae DSM 7213 TaxID=767817 RepID=R4KBG6_9FIRM|nr:preprotein translocase subunit SecE [Desulfoscipio gibsoniae]AGK99928.1 preprotein translocase, SecE subunit [Desulfoscipio gibsoniae DSM 7213]
MAVTKKQDGSMKKDKGAGKELVKKDNRKEVAKKNAAANKPALVDRARTFFRGVTNELKKVHWPNRRETMIYTAVVLVSVVFVAVLIWVFDIILGSAMGMLIK